MRLRRLSTFGVDDPEIRDWWFALAWKKDSAGLRLQANFGSMFAMLSAMHGENCVQVLSNHADDINLLVVDPDNPDAVMLAQTCLNSIAEDGLLDFDGFEYLVDKTVRVVWRDLPISGRIDACRHSNVSLDAAITDDWDELHPDLRGYLLQRVRDMPG